MRDFITMSYAVVGSILSAAGIAAPLNDALRGTDTSFCFTATSAGLTALAVGVAMLVQASRPRR